MNKIIILILILALGAGAYFLLGKSEGTEEDLLGTDGEAGTEEMMDDDLGSEDAMKEDEMMEDGEMMEDDDHSDDTMMEEDGAMEEETMEEGTEETMEEAEPEPVSTNTSGFTNGTYTASADYNAPKNNVETVNINLTLADGVIESINTTYEANHEISKARQAAFDEAYKSQVVGKKIDEVSLSRVGGSSLTTVGFMDALETIVDEARA